MGLQGHEQRAGAPAAQNANSCARIKGWCPDLGTAKERRRNVCAGSPERDARARSASRLWPDHRVDQQELQRRLLELAGEVGGAVSERHSVTEASAEFARKRVILGVLKPRSIEAYNRTLRKIDGLWGDRLITEDFLPLAAELVAMEGQTAWRVLQVLRSILLHAIKIGWRSEPHGLDALIKRTEYLPRETVYDERQVVEIVAACERLDRADAQHAERSAAFAGCTYGIRCRAREVLRLLALTGCRLREICQLRFDEIHPGYLRLRDSKTGARVVPLGDQAQRVLGRQRIVSGVVFPGRWPHKPIGARTVQQAFDEVKREAGLRDGSVHTLRHTAATLLIRNGVPLQVVQKILGHATASYVTARYVHLAARDTSLGIAVLENAITKAGEP